MAVASLVRHVSNYSLGSIAMTLAGLVSFPLLTRLLGVEGYGYMSLVTLTLIPLVAFGKCGLQHSAMVFYAQARRGREAWGLDQYYTTLLVGMGLSALAVTVVWFVLMEILAGRLEASLPALFRLAAPLIVIRVMESALLNILRAREMSGSAALWRVTQRYTVLALVVGGLLWVEGSVEVFLVASIIAEALVVLAMAVQVLRGVPLHLRFFSRRLFLSMAAFGVPMLGFEMAGVATSISDRYIIELLLGGEALGQYSAAYNLSEYVAGTLVMALGTAVLPMYLRIWQEKGEQATRDFIRDSLRLYAFVALPLAAGFAAVAGNFLELMASSDFTGGAGTIPWIMAGLVLNGAVVMLGAGLYLARRSAQLMKALAAAAVLNVILNFVLIPPLGIVGAAVATLISYLLYAVLAMHMATPVLRVSLPWRNIANYLLASVVMYVVVADIALADVMVTLPVQVLAGVLVYALVVFVMDRESRAILAGLANRLRE